MLKSQIENATRAGLPVDFEGYGRLAPCKTVWLGRTLAEAAHALGVTAGEVAS